MGIISNIKELYKGEDILYKHLSLACISGIVTLTSDSELWKNLLTDGNGMMVLACAVTAILGTFYLFGYLIESVHYRLQTGIVVLPELTNQPFMRGLAMLLMILVWGVFCSIIGVVLMVIPAMTGVIPLAFIGCLAFMLYASFVPFVYIAYAKDYQSTGLFNLGLPFKFMKIALADLIIASLKYILTYICAIIPAIIIGVLLYFINNTIGLAVAICLIGYISFILQLVWFNVLAEIYEQKIDGMVDGLD